jgi:uncharacterized oligopeptide transporter (OPT) family protein
MEHTEQFEPLVVWRAPEHSIQPADGTAGFTGTIPALEYVIGPAENGPIRLSSTKLVVWSIGLCFFGLIFASLLRESLIVREKLPWPGLQQHRS